MLARPWPVIHPSRGRRCGVIALALCLATSLTGSSANAGGLHPEMGLGVRGLLGLGKFARVSRFAYGGDLTLNVVPLAGGFGLRAAGGLQFLEQHKTGTGEVIFAGAGTQEAQFITNQKFSWVAIGPEWSMPFGDDHIDWYLMAGRANVNATSSGTYFTVVGPDPGTTRTSLVVAGAMWSTSGSWSEFGVELFASGSARVWDDPPIVRDGSGTNVTRSRDASIAGIVARWGIHFGLGAGAE